MSKCRSSKKRGSLTKTGKINPYWSVSQEANQPFVELACGCVNKPMNFQGNNSVIRTCFTDVLPQTGVEFKCRESFEGISDSGRFSCGEKTGYIELSLPHVQFAAMCRVD